MTLPAHRKYFLNLDDHEHVFSAAQETEDTFKQHLLNSIGRAAIAADDGNRSWLHRILGVKVWIRNYLAIEWENEYAGLVFYDENSSEYWPLGSESESPLENDSLNIKFGENDRIEGKYIMSKSRAVEAIDYFLDKQERPGWLD